MAICCRTHYNIPLTKPVKVTDKVKLDLAAFSKKGDEASYDPPADDFFCGGSSLRSAFVNAAVFLWLKMVLALTFIVEVDSLPGQGT